MATQTVYATVDTKPEPFRLLTETAISGTSQPVPVLQRRLHECSRADQPLVSGDQRNTPS